MTLNYSIIAGVLGGAFCTFVLYYLTAYRKVGRSNNEKEVQLMQLKTECEELSSTIFHMETQRQMDQQNASKEKTQLLSELQQIRTDKTNLENQYAKDNTNWNKEQDKIEVLLSLCYNIFGFAALQKFGWIRRKHSSGNQG